jgi:transcriptional regulator with XRE-family HTH domain
MTFKELRQAKGVRQQELANRIDVSQARISRLDNGAVPSAIEVIKLAKAFRVSEKRILNIYRKVSE